MKFVCEKAVLLSAITKTSWAVSAKSSSPIMEGLLLDAENELSITGFDLSTGIEVKVPAEIEEKGSVVVNAKLLFDIIRLLPDESLSFEATKEMFAVIKCKDVRHDVVCFDSDDYPELPELETQYLLSLRQSDLKKMISQTIFAISGDESKPVHTGSLFDVDGNKMNLVSVDGFRLSYRTAEVVNESEEEKFSFVVPGATLKEVEKLCSDSDEEAVIRVGKKHITFTIGSSMIISRILEGEFLNYKKAVPKEETFRVRVNRRDLITSIERTAILINERIKNPIHLLFSEKNLIVSCKTPLGRSKDVCPLLGTGEKLEIGFNHKYLLDALRACPDDEVMLSLNTHIAPIIITPPESDEYLHLILPVRLKS